ncbi:MAG: pilus assembly protein PilM [Candidatus Aquirickettsiella sp.]
MYFFKDRFKNIHNPDATIGLDIGNSMIKWVSLGCNQELKQYAIQTISSPMAIAHKDIAQIATILKKTLHQRESIRNCVVNIPDILICSKLMQIDRADSQRIEEIIELLVEQSIPYPLHKIYFDYQVFDPSSEKPTILIVACHKEHLDFRLKIIQQANLIPIAVDVSSHALERAYSFFYSDRVNENTILLDIGATQLSLLFLNNFYTIVYCENLFHSEEQESILLQIKRSVKRYVLAHPYCILKQIFLIGANKLLLNYLVNRLDGFLELKIQILKQGDRIKFNSQLNRSKLEENFLNIFLSYGLALKINSSL